MVRWGAHKATTQSDNNWFPEKVHVAETCRDYQNREFASSPVESIFQLQVVQIQLCKYISIISCTYNICTSCIERSTARPRFESRAMPCCAMPCRAVPCRAMTAIPLGIPPDAGFCRGQLDGLNDRGGNIDIRFHFGIVREQRISMGDGLKPSDITAITARQ